MNLLFARTRSNSGAALRRAAATFAPNTLAVLVLCGLCGVHVMASPLEAADREFESAAPGERVVWVRFADKDLADESALRGALRAADASLSDRARSRRAKVRAPAADLLDVPVSARYVEAVRGTGASVRHASRWLNAVSVRADAAAIQAIEALSFVVAVDDVATTRHRIPIVERAPSDATSGDADRSGAPRSITYGHCASQIVPIQVNQLHDAGFSGAGVLVALFDTGFLRTHQSLDGVTVVAEHDFVQGDGTTSNQAGDDPNQHNHGTMCLSLCAGFDPGNLVGPAYGATYVLAKTETILSETPAEEDNWVAAAEWAEGLGVDVISSSLGYKDWYTYEDMDGETAPITIAADLAVSLGVCVFTSAGNEGDDPWFYVTAPADGDLVMSIGAVDSLGTIAAFSSHGPTFDGRTKPDVCAMGRGDYVALPWDNAGYGRGSGTSFSCPLSAGVAALLLQAHPNWGPMQVRDALRSTATQSSAPDNTYGWGILRAADARAAATGAPEIAAAGGDDSTPETCFAAPNPASGTTFLRAELREGEEVRGVAILDVRGRIVRTIEPTGATQRGEPIAWDGLDGAGRPVPAALYFARMQTSHGVRVARVLRLR